MEVLRSMNAVVDAQVGRYVPPVVSSWLAKADALAPVPPGTALTLVLALVTLWLASKIVGAIFGGGSARRRRTGDTVLFVGLSGGGKTAMFHKLCFGSTPKTLTSMAEAVTRCTLFDASADGDGDAASKQQTFTFVDYPGHARLRGRALYAHAGKARAVVFVVDATKGDADSMRRCAELLYDLFTNIQFVEQLPPLLVACHKADADGALSPADIRGKLEAALELLKATRASLGTTSADDQSLRLGRAGQPFNFDVDSPGEVEFCASSLQAPVGLDAVRDFVDTCMTRD